MSSAPVCYAEVAVVSNEDQDEEAANLAVVGVAVENRVRTTSFTHIPQALGCTWNDDYYENKHGIIAAFDIDMELVQNFYTKYRCQHLILFLAFVAMDVLSRALVYWSDGDSGSYFGLIYICFVYGNDDYYENKHGIIAAFDRDLELVRKFYTKVRCLFVSLFLAYVVQDALSRAFLGDSGDNFVLIYICFLYGIVFKRQYAAQQALKHQHIAISTEGVRIDNSMGMNVTIPFDLIDTIEAFPQKICWCRNAGFQTVRIHRGLTEMERGSCTCSKTVESCIHGIKNADAFVRLVNVLKADSSIAVASAASVPEASAEMIERSCKGKQVV